MTYIKNNVFLLHHDHPLTLFQCKGMQDLKSTIWGYVTKLTNL